MVRRLDKAEWRPFLDALSKQIEGKEAEVEVATLEIGVQIEASWLPIYGLVYDPKSDRLEVLLEGIDHMIDHPCDLYIDGEVPFVKSLEVITARGVREFVKLRDPLALPRSADEFQRN